MNDQVSVAAEELAKWLPYRYELKTTRKAWNEKLPALEELDAPVRMPIPKGPLKD